MRTLACLAALAALASCTAGGSRRREEPAPVEPSGGPTSDLVSVDYSSMQVGQYAIYGVQERGRAETGHVKYACVAAEPDGTLWFEMTMPANQGQVIWKLRVDRKDRVHEMWAGDPRSTQPPSACRCCGSRT